MAKKGSGGGIRVRMRGGQGWNEAWRQVEEEEVTGGGGPEVTAGSGRKRKIRLKGG